MNDLPMAAGLTGDQEERLRALLGKLTEIFVMLADPQTAAAVSTVAGLSRLTRAHIAARPPAIGEGEDLLTAEEAAAYVRCPSVTAFYEWRKRRHVPTCRLGARGKILVRKRDLDQALQPPPAHGARSAQPRRHFFTGVERTRR
jgi:Helix-turn-helix domain